MSETELAQSILDYINLYSARSSVQVAVIKEMCLEHLHGPLPGSVFGGDLDE